MAEIDPDTLKEIMSYNPDTGDIIWKRRHGRHFPSKASCNRWNARFAGRLAMTTNRASGHLGGRVFNKELKAHRVAWAIFYGEWPNGEIDHINGDGRDNRISNLRCVSRSMNMRNVAKRSTNTSGYTGVSLNKSTGKWHARVSGDNGVISLGNHRCPTAAHFAALRKRRELGYTDRHGK